MASTSKGSRIFVHMLNRPLDELRLPVIPRRTITSVSMLGGGRLQFRTEGNQAIVLLPHEATDENDAVVVLDLDGTTEGIAPLDVPDNTFGKMDDMKTE
jgi:hypothetical protein